MAPREQFRKCGVDYEPAAKPKSELYGKLLPVINSRRVALLDNGRLVSQLISLERRTSRGGRDSISEPPGANDDLANAIAGAVSMAAGDSAPFEISDTLLTRAAEGGGRHHSNLQSELLRQMHDRKRFGSSFEGENRWF